MRRKRKGAGLYLIIVFAVIVLGYLMVGGIVPSFKLTPSDTSSEWEMIIPSPQGGKNSLQLDPIKFRKCSGTTGIDFLIDNSGSMKGVKLSELKKGVLAFTSQLSDESVLGMQKFSNKTNIKEVFPLSYYSGLKSQITQAVNSMDANGWTYSKDAFIFTKQKLDLGIPNFPKYKFALIFVSDGVPETGRVQGERFDPQQDPTEIATQIKGEGIRIFTIAYVNQGDQAVNNQLQTLMRNVASSPSDYYQAPDATKIGQILNQIAVKLCNEPQ